ncbi:hypothetical protein DICSQDRAFT_183328 [Dichomitus squalens LYAD-421 SS1]|uniref:F-box domain-containing protein n=1 Tax=Dichomitus squalens (strain LYAD-421) TaxID=732165 RepID=R7SM39_DICSQ|nr:uncharacterized protein DICSQDRAFT_183328 [Dichomitus squalens LYAD-421 SS1]EJF57204.1 hypothetical protein DICSQDRAFT_183328 [Dichomitus squalens LYAD-421 SS1]
MSLGPTLALANQDVLYTVFEHFVASETAWYDFDIMTRRVKSVDDPEEIVRRRTLASCARVCRAFLFPAMTILWRDLDSLEPLNALVQHRASQVTESIAQFLDSTISTTFLRIGRCWTATTFTLAPRTITLGAEVFRGAPAWDHHRRCEYQTFVETLLLRAAESAPCLTYLRITRGNGILEDWLRPVCRFSRVQVLDILEPAYDAVTTSDLLPRLGAMESLRSLKLRLPAAVGHAFDNGTQSFTALRVLDLGSRFASLHDAIKMLRLVSSPYLESVHVDGCECETGLLSAGLHDLCTVLDARFAPTLRTISLSITPIGSPIAFEQPLVKYLIPLLRIRHLADVRLHLASKNVSVVVSVSDFVTIAESWPHLEHLELSYVPSGKAPSLRALIPLARLCPFLTHVQLPRIDARDVEMASIPSHRSLMSFSISDGGWDSLIPDPQGVAYFLRKLFPNAELGRPHLASEQWCRTVKEFRDSRARKDRGNDLVYCWTSLVVLEVGHSPCN